MFTPWELSRAQGESQGLKTIPLLSSPCPPFSVPHRRLILASFFRGILLTLSSLRQCSKLIPLHLWPLLPSVETHLPILCLSSLSPIFLPLLSFKTYPQTSRFPSPSLEALSYTSPSPSIARNLLPNRLSFAIARNSPLIPRLTQILVPGSSPLPTVL